MSSSQSEVTPVPVDVAGNAGIAMFAKALYLVTRLCIPPLVLAHISLGEYGLWTACFILIMYVGLTDVGFSNVYVRFTARFHAEGNVNGINRLLSTGVILLSGMALVVFVCVWLALPLILNFLKIDAILQEKARILVLGTTGLFLIDLTLGAYCYLLHGMQRIKEEQKVAIVGYLLELLLIVSFLSTGFGVYSLLLAFALRYTWSLLSFMHLAHRFLPGLQIRLRHYDKKMLHHFFGFGATVQASALLGTVLFSIDRLLAGALLGPKGIALFELAAKLPVSALTVPSVISNVTLATASRHDALDNRRAIRDLFLQATRSTSLIAAFPLGFIAIFAEPIGRAWLGNGVGLNGDLNGLSMIMTLTALWSHLHIMTGPGSAILRAIGRAGNEFIYHGLRFGLITISVCAALLVASSTVLGLAWGLAIGGAAAATTYLFINQRFLEIPAQRMLSDVLWPGLLAYPLAGLLRLIWELLLPATAGRWETLAGLGLFGALYTVGYLLLIWHWLLTRSERMRLVELVGRFTGRLPCWKNS